MNQSDHWAGSIGMGDRVELARACAASGVLLGMSPRAWRDAGREPLDDALAEEIVRWRLGFPEPRPGTASTRALARRWMTAGARARERGTSVRLRMQLTAAERQNPWAELVMGPESDVDGAFVALRRSAGRHRSWHHPPRIGVLDPAMRAALAEAGNEVVLLDTGTTCDLLVAEAAPIPDVLDVRATFVVLLDDGRAQVETLARRVSAAGWAAVTTASEMRGAIIAQLLDTALHVPLDVALRRVTQQHGLQPPYLMADPSVLIYTDPEHLRLPDPLQADADMMVLESKILASPGSGRDLPPHAIVEPEPPSSAGVRPPRHLQGVIVPSAAPAEAERPSELEPGGAYDLVLRIGAKDPGWAALREPLPEAWPDQHESHVLRVVLSLPSMLDTPQERNLTLPASGGSGEARFTVTMPEAPGPHQGRAIVLHQGRVLQTSRVTLHTGHLPPLVDGPLTLELETVPRPELEDLTGRRSFGAAFVVNHGPDGTPTTTAIPAGGVPLYLPTGWDIASENLRTTLQEIVDRELGGDESADADATELLRLLALQGDTLRGLVDEHLGLAGGWLPALQVVSARPDAWLPLELVYDGPIPEDDDAPASVCERALERLGTAHPNEPCDANHDANVICPLGFWGLRAVIERQAHDPALEHSAWQWRVSSEPLPGRNRLTAPTNAVFAAHRNVDVKQPDASAQIVATLEAIGLHDCRVFSWDRWREAVNDRQPGLLIALAHTGELTSRIRSGAMIRSGVATMEIEVGRLKVNSVAPSYVAKDESIRPVVLLLGCSTAAVDVPFQGFVAAFRRAGAPVVIGTVTDVLGRFAAATARVAIEQFANAAGDDLDVGEAMLRLRRRLLSEGLTLGLALLAYGDADWRLGLPTS